MSGSLQAASKQNLPKASYAVVWESAATNYQKTVWLYRADKQIFPTEFSNALMHLGPFDNSHTKKTTLGLDFRNSEAASFVSGKKRLIISPQYGWVSYYDDTADSPKVPFESVLDWSEVRARTLEWTKILGVQSNELCFNIRSNDFQSFRTDSTRSSFNPRTKERSEPKVVNRGIIFVRSLDGVCFTGLGTVGGIACQYGNKGGLYNLELIWKNYVRVRELNLPSPEALTEAIRDGKAQLQFGEAPFFQPETIRVRQVELSYFGLKNTERDGYLKPLIGLDVEITSVGKTNISRLTIEPSFE